MLLSDLRRFLANRNTSVCPVRPMDYDLPSGRNQGRWGNKSQSALCTKKQTSSSCFYPRTRLLPLICPVTVIQRAYVCYGSACACVYVCVWDLSASMHKSVHVCMCSQQWVGWGEWRRRKSGMSRRRPVVKASTKAKDSTELAGTQRSLAFPVKVTHTHKLRTAAGPWQCIRKNNYFQAFVG